MARNPTNQDVSWFLDLDKKGQLDLDPPYQRRSVWSPRDRRFFIDTVLNNYPAPPVFLHKTMDQDGRTTYHVVDGKQRLQTIIDFTKDKVRIPDDFGDSTLQKKRWKDLERPTRELFWNYVLVVEMLPDVSDSFVRNIFERINRNSRKLARQEMRHAKYDGWFITTVEAEAAKREWDTFGLVTTARQKRMADVQFISELFGVLVRRRIDGFDQDALDDLCAEYDDLSEQPTFVEDDFLADVERIKDYISAALRLAPTIRDYLRVQTHLYSLWAYLALEGPRLLSVDEFVARYVPFVRDIRPAIEASETTLLPVAEPEETGYREAVAEYAANTRGASTDQTPRTKRHRALLVAIHGSSAAPP